jgi:hypothetical protein
MICGKVRVGDGIFSKRRYEQWTGCAREIIPAKRRLLTHLNSLCQAQAAAISKGTNSDAETSRVVVSDKTTINRAQGQSRASNATRRLHEGTERGVIYTGKPEHFRDIYQSVYALRHIANSTLPVEIWANALDVPLCHHIFGRHPAVRLSTLLAYVHNDEPQPVPNIVKGRFVFWHYDRSRVSHYLRRQSASRASSTLFCRPP